MTIRLIAALAGSRAATAARLRALQDLRIGTTGDPAFLCR
jgi:hypothetical protein